MPDYDDPNFSSIDDEELDEFEHSFLSQIESDKAWALGFYSERNLEFERMEKWYFKDHYSTDAEISSGELMDEATDDTEHLTIVNIPTNMINTVHGVLTDEEFYIEAISSIGRKSQEAATKTERFCHGTYWINRQVNGSDPIEDSCQDMLVYGWGCLYSYWDVDRAKLARSKTAGRSKDVLDFYAYPIVVKRINPRDIYPLPHGVREKWRGVMQILYRAVHEVENEWNMELEEKPLRKANGDLDLNDDGSIAYETFEPDEMIEYVDYWTWRRDNGEKGNKFDDCWTLWHAITAGGQYVKYPTPMPEYEMLPYEIFFCRKSVSDSGSRMGLSFLYPIIEPVQEMELLANRITRMIELYADPITVIRGGSADDSTDIEKGPGSIIEVDADGGVEYLSWQGTPPAVDNLMKFWRENAQDAFPPVMTGLQGGTSGLDTIALQQGGKLQTNKPRRNLELAIQRLNTKVIRLLQRFSWEDPVYVLGQRSEKDEVASFDFSIKGRDTRGYENTTVTVRGRFPQEEMRNITIAGQAVSAGIMSSREAGSKYLYQQDPERSFRMAQEERLLQDPKLTEFFFQNYTMLPAKSPVTMALEGDETSMPMDPSQMQPSSDMAGGLIAAASAETPTQVQQGVQRTPVESNAFSAMMGGVPSGPPGG